MAEVPAGGDVDARHLQGPLTVSEFIQQTA